MKRESLLFMSKVKYCINQLSHVEHHVDRARMEEKVSSRNM